MSVPVNEMLDMKKKIHECTLTLEKYRAIVRNDYPDNLRATTLLAEMDYTLSMLEPFREGSIPLQGGRAEPIYAYLLNLRSQFEKFDKSTKQKKEDSRVNMLQWSRLSNINWGIPDYAETKHAQLPLIKKLPR